MMPIIDVISVTLALRALSNGSWVLVALFGIPYIRGNLSGLLGLRHQYFNMCLFKPPKGTSLRQTASFEPSLNLKIPQQVRTGGNDRDIK